MPKFESTLRLSNYFVIIQLVMLIGGVTCTLFLNFSLLIKCLLCFSLVIYSFWNVYWQTRWQGILHDGKDWYLQRLNEKVPVIFYGESIVTSFVSILLFKQGNFLKKSCVILKDSMPADQYRQFTVRIKYF